jgi:sarcosine oxidase
MTTTLPSSAQTLIVGAGVLGAAIADELSRAGHDVVLADMNVPGHATSASGDTTRILRSGYGTSERYTRAARQARGQWLALAERTGEDLLLDTGALWLATGDGAFEEATYRELSRQEIPVERLTGGQIAELFPSINVQDVRFGVYEPEAGVLRARQCVQTLVGSAVAHGATVAQATARPNGASVELNGEPFQAENVIWAAGAWLPGLFPDTVNCVTTRQDAYFVHADGDAWALENIPAWIDPAGMRYGIGAEDGRLKIASSAVGPTYDPWAPRPAPSQDEEDSALLYAEHRFPALAPARSAGMRACQYSSTADTQFILAKHPARDRWWFAGGDSGHAFKHAIGIGEHVRALVEGAPEDPDFGLGVRDGSRGLRVSTN